MHATARCEPKQATPMSNGDLGPWLSIGDGIEGAASARPLFNQACKRSKARVEPQWPLRRVLTLLPPQCFVRAPGQKTPHHVERDPLSRVKGRGG